MTKRGSHPQAACSQRQGFSGAFVLGTSGILWSSSAWTAARADGRWLLSGDPKPCTDLLSAFLSTPRPSLSWLHGLSPVGGQRGSPVTGVCSKVAVGQGGDRSIGLSVAHNCYGLLLSQMLDVTLTLFSLFLSKMEMALDSAAVHRTGWLERDLCDH